MMKLKQLEQIITTNKKNSRNIRLQLLKHNEHITTKTPEQLLQQHTTHYCNMQIEETETISQKQYYNTSKLIFETFRNTCCNISNRLLQHHNIHDSHEIREKEGRHMGWGRPRGVDRAASTDGMRWDGGWATVA
jgi:nitrous oxide reductase accessory protein NosL